MYINASAESLQTIVWQYMPQLLPLPNRAAKPLSNLSVKSQPIPALNDEAVKVCIRICRDAAVFTYSSSSQLYYFHSDSGGWQLRVHRHGSHQSLDHSYKKLPFIFNQASEVFCITLFIISGCLPWNLLSLVQSVSLSFYLWNCLTKYLCPLTCHWHLSSVIWHVSSVLCHLPFVIWHVSIYLSFVGSLASIRFFVFLLYKRCSSLDYSIFGYFFFQINWSALFSPGCLFIVSVFLY